jgi:hypothetical protein
VRRRSIALAAAMSLALACGDPVHDNAVAALGPEDPGVRPGPTHRPGQPCLTCHDGSGPGGTKFSLAGTIYKIKGEPDVLPGATVHLTDVNGSTHDVQTNDAGNFFVPFSDWAPGAPLRVEISYQDIIVQMNTHIGRDGSCASCHYDPPGTRTPGRVVLSKSPEDFPGAATP